MVGGQVFPSRGELKSKVYYLLRSAVRSARAPSLRCISDARSLICVCVCLVSVCACLCGWAGGWLSPGCWRVTLGR